MGLLQSSWQQCPYATAASAVFHMHSARLGANSGISQTQLLMSLSSHTFRLSDRLWGCIEQPLHATTLLNHVLGLPVLHGRVLTQCMQTSVLPNKPNLRYLCHVQVAAAAHPSRAC